MILKTFNLLTLFSNKIMHFCLHMQTSRQVLGTSQFLHTFQIDNNNPYTLTLTYQYIQKVQPCDKPQ